MKDLEWATREIEILKSQLHDEGDQNACAAALAVYGQVLNLIEPLKKEKSDNLAVILLRNLLSGEVLSPIEDMEPSWILVSGYDPASDDKANPGFSIYQCARRESLYKEVRYDRKTGEIDDIRFTDKKRSYCVDINTEEMYRNDFANSILDEVLPIKMPYQPNGYIRIFTEEFQAYPESETADTFGILKIRLESGMMQDVMRFFKLDHKTNQMAEIKKDEYFYRKKKSEEKK